MNNVNVIGTLGLDFLVFQFVLQTEILLTTLISVDNETDTDQCFCLSELVFSPLWLRVNYNSCNQFFTSLQQEVEFNISCQLERAEQRRVVSHIQTGKWCFQINLRSCETQTSLLLLVRCEQHHQHKHSIKLWKNYDSFSYHQNMFFSDIRLSYSSSRFNVATRRLHYVNLIFACALEVMYCVSEHGKRPHVVP